MKALFYKSLVGSTRIFGLWFFSLISRGIAAGYYFLSPKRVAVGVQHYAALFPHKSRFSHLWCTWRQFQNFTTIHMDRFVVDDKRGLHYTSKGLEHLEAALKRGDGGILLMSHVGNWEVATRLLRRRLPGLRLLLYMGARNREEIESIQKDAVVKSGVKIIVVNEEEGAPTDIVEGITFLRSGGFVSMSGDLVWQRDPKTVPAQFLGHEIHIPEIPYVLSLVSGAPLFVFFAFRKGNRQYHFTTSGPLYVRAPERSMRDRAVRSAAQTYANLLEEAIRSHPFQWYHFEAFFDKKNSR